GRAGNGLLAVHGLGYDLDVRLGVQQDGKAGSHHALVVGDHDADRHGAPSGSLPSGRAAGTRNSPLAAGRGARGTPSMVARSRMPIMPCPPPSLGPGSRGCSHNACTPGATESLRTSITRAASP